MSEPKAAYVTNTAHLANELAADLREERGHLHAWQFSFRGTQDNELTLHVVAFCACGAELSEGKILEVLNLNVQDRFTGFGRMFGWGGERLER